MDAVQFDPQAQDPDESLITRIGSVRRVIKYRLRLIPHVERDSNETNNIERFLV